MQERAKVQHVPVKVYRTPDRLMIAAPMPGLEPEDIRVDLMEDKRLILHGNVRGVLKDVKELLIDEWTVGGYLRELQLADNVDGERANLSYGNGVLVIALPFSDTFRPAHLALDTVGVARGQRVGNAGHPPS